MAKRTPHFCSRINPRDYQRLMTLCIEIQPSYLAKAEKKTLVSPVIAGLRRL